MQNTNKREFRDSKNPPYGRVSNILSMQYIGDEEKALSLYLFLGTDIL